MNTGITSVNEWSARMARLERRRQQRARRRALRQGARLLAVGAAAVLLCSAFSRLHLSDRTPADTADEVLLYSLDTLDSQDPYAVYIEEAAEDAPPLSGGFAYPWESGNTVALLDDVSASAVQSLYAVALDAQSGEILAERSSDTRINPASMTKVLTLLTAVEAIETGTAAPDGVTAWKGSAPLEGVAVITKDIRDYCWSNQCSVAYYETYEKPVVEDLLYAAILPSGADASLALANYVAGSHPAFVDRMNEKAASLGLQDAHFTNCVGLYDPDHHCTVRDMAVIMKAAMDNALCRQVLGARTWRTRSTEEHPNGLLLTNRFLRSADKQDAGLTFLGAKTGYVRQSGNCAVSMAVRADGREFVCATGMAAGSSQAIRDHAALYRIWCQS